eukprot:5819716-Pyramimonas_sp.AAC.1
MLTRTHHLVCSGLPYIEPSFATVVESQDAECHGVGYYVTEEQWERIKETERGYDIAEVECRSYSGEKFSGVTLVFPAAQRRQGLSPSKRYRQTNDVGAVPSPPEELQFSSNKGRLSRLVAYC